MMYQIEKLNEKFNKIKEMGWIKSLRNGYTGIGFTFETLIGKVEDSSELPDFDGIEIKTKRGYSKSYTTLFCASPQGITSYETKRIYDCYGYRSPKDKKSKVLYASVYSDFIDDVGLNYKFSLQVCPNEKKIYLLVFDRIGNMIDKSSYWSFDVLEEKLYRKMKYLAFVKASRKFINGVEYFKYDSIKFYKLKDFNAFIDLLKNRKIRINFKIGMFTNGDKIGQLDNHGTSFSIKECDLDLLYDVMQT